MLSELQQKGQKIKDKKKLTIACKLLVMGEIYE